MKSSVIVMSRCQHLRSKCRALKIAAAKMMRMPISEVPFRHVMTKSVQRAFNNPLYVGTPPLDLRTTPVMRRTNSMEGNVKRPLLGRQTESNAIESQTTPVIRRTRKLERKNLAVAIDDRKD
ncbi:hypothetical protein Bhyg_15592, partial [Pseudolycoriella hygida]